MLNHRGFFMRLIYTSELGLANSGEDVTGGLRIGIHLQGIGENGGSESLVNGPVVPVPAAAWLFGSALIGLAGLKRKQR